MSNKILLLALLSALLFVETSAVNCTQPSQTDSTESSCSGNYCYYVNYTSLDAAGIPQDSTVFYGCTDSYVLEIPPKSGVKWTFPINNCQHFQTNNTVGTNGAYFYGNVCNTRDNCTYVAGGDDLVCAGVRLSPILALFLMIFGMLIVKFFV
jgi:hypothetical protein